MALIKAKVGLLPTEVRMSTRAQPHLERAGLEPAFTIIGAPRRERSRQGSTDDCAASKKRAQWKQCWKQPGAYLVADVDHAAAGER